ncbi:MAG: ubiquinone/menaquinone biosynthesis methyltransferase [Actinobacteria bacterium]|nr:ubiquinone/menaquinone biosynthesis methyltransferase [Actinomycetota bacterium]
MENNNITGEFLKPMFGGIIRHYDLINHVFTFGMDSRWRKNLVSRCLETGHRRFLDLGCGTGGLAVKIAILSTNDSEITACDFSREMLGIASKKAGKSGVKDKISFIHADASAMPFDDNYFDCIGISFAFRNMIYRNPSALKNLHEIRRVLKPQGSLIIAESGQPEVKIIRKLHHFYIRTFVYLAGSIISGNRQAYKYLSQSAINFYFPDKIREIIIKTGFSHFNYYPLFFGAAGIYHIIK